MVKVSDDTPLWVRESFVNLTKGHMFGEGEPYETAYTFAEKGRLYKDLVREYGRCTGKMYRDRRSGPPQVVGWVFVKRMKYEDARTDRPSDYYLREVWVEVMARDEEKITLRPTINIDTGEEIPATGIFEKPGSPTYEVREVSDATQEA